MTQQNKPQNNYSEKWYEIKNNMLSALKIVQLHWRR